MRWWPQSLFGRLLGIAAITTAAALLFAGLSIGHVLERFVMQGLDQRLDAQIMVLARAVRADGTLDRGGAIDLPGFGVAGSGWTWRVDAGGRHWSSGVEASGASTFEDRPEPDGPIPPGRSDDERSRPRAGENIARGGERLHCRVLTVPSAAGPVRIIASGPRRVVAVPLRGAMVPLLLSLGLLGIGLAAATLIQLKLGLRPLRRLEAALVEVRAGRQRHVPEDQPIELRPLATELNALIDQNEAGLAHARRHVSNLAHGLKTPLAALSLRLGEAGHDPDGSLAVLVAQIDGRVRHHLGRARASAPGGGPRVRTTLAPAVADLVGVLERVHADRGVAIRIMIADDVAVAMEAEDLTELVGNLLDNGWRHARSMVSVEAVREGSEVRIAIADDGPGIAETMLAAVMMPGRRLDERGDGHGFGLPIAQELAELNGGSLALARSDALGGLCATIRLPAASTA